MKFYWIQTPNWLAKFFNAFEWRKSTKEKVVYLTFDDGPIPVITPWVLNQLNEFNAKATFFCIGDNIRKNPDILKQICDQGHAVGNHTYNHVSGWKTDLRTYIDQVEKCEEFLALAENRKEKLMRPPYGKIGFNQTKTIKKQNFRIIMWDILSADFDTSISKEQCLENVTKNIRPGSIIIFHDSRKAFPNMEFALRGTLEYLQKNGYKSAALY